MKGKSKGLNYYYYYYFLWKEKKFDFIRKQKIPQRGLVRKKFNGQHSGLIQIENISNWSVRNTY